MEKWYYANTWMNKIEPVEVERHTDDSVWVKGRRKARSTTGDIYAPTWGGAREFLAAHWEAMRASAIKKANYAMEGMARVPKEEPPKGP